MDSNQIRQKYLDFMASKGHVIVPSSSLIPENDSTTLFTSSGMQPMIPYLLGKSHPHGNRISDSQKCFRSQDIEEVGDNRHTTFFEMLGNWSLGDYFKKEQIEYFFTFLTDKEVGLGLDPNRLYASFFSGDESAGVGIDQEAVDALISVFKKFSINAKVGERIFGYSSKKNWWSRSGPPQNMPVGEPGGPDAEVFYDFGAELKLHESSKWKDEPCHINCDCGRYLEIGNSVFMQFKKEVDGTLSELPSKNIDFGGGLSRLEACLRNDPDIFNISLFAPIVKKLEDLTQQKYQQEELKSSFRIISDHITAAVFLIKDGVLPSNKEQGYVLRRLIRRSALKYHTLSLLNLNDLVQLVNIVIDIYGEIYFDKKSDPEQISRIIETELAKFSKSLSLGLKEIEKLIAQKQTVSGEDAFWLYESFGFPVELVQEELKKHNLTLDLDAFNAKKQAHQDASRTLSAGKFRSGLADNSEIIIKYHTATHLLHSALRQVLGLETHQDGSNNTGDRLRFDFTYNQKLTNEQVSQVQNLVNDQIKANLSVTTKTIPFKQAQEEGYLAFFKGRYPDTVSVYDIGDFSHEVCTGPHVEKTGVLGRFEIYKEEGVSGQVRRIYAKLI